MVRVSEPNPTDGLTVLVVDDEDDIRDTLKAVIQAQLPGVRVLTAPSGDAALQTIAAAPVDLILTDYRMPGQDGLTFLEHARRLAPRVPRVVMTAFAEMDIVLRAINEAKVERFLTKPLEPQSAVATVGALLARRKAEKEQHRDFARSLDLLRRKVAGT